VQCKLTLMEIRDKTLHWQCEATNLYSSQWRIPDQEIQARSRRLLSTLKPLLAYSNT
jgi:hypothetical protein